MEVVNGFVEFPQALVSNRAIVVGRNVLRVQANCLIAVGEGLIELAHRKVDRPTARIG